MISSVPGGTLDFILLFFFLTCFNFTLNAVTGCSYVFTQDHDRKTMGNPKKLKFIIA